MNIETRQIGNTGIEITAVALGCWPIAGMTSLDVNDHDSLNTLRAAIDAGINFFDTAYGYGPDGESERLISQLIKGRREQMVVATKGGIHWDVQGQRVLDARPATLSYQCDRSLV